MKPVIETIFHDAENHYLKPEVLTEVSQYMTSLKDRTNLYRTIRDQELNWMQPIADELENHFPEEQTIRLETCLRHAMLALRHCSMAMLMDDPNYLTHRFLGWFHESIEIHASLEIDRHLHTALRKQLSLNLSAPQFRLITPFLDQIQAGFEPEAVVNDDSLLTVAGLF